MGWFLLTSTVRFIKIQKFYQLKYLNKNQIIGKQDFSTKSIHALLSKDQKNKLRHYILGIGMVSISYLSKYSKFNSKTI